MTLPAPLEAALEEEAVVSRVPLGGDDELVVTPTRFLRYEGEGLLNDEAVEAFPNDATGLRLSTGRRKSRFTLEYALEERSFTVPADTTEDVLHPVLAGVLAGSDVTEPGESVLEPFRFSELTVVLTSHRLVKHVGEAVWGEEYETCDYADVTGVSLEEGSVSSQVVLTVGGRLERIKVPTDRASALAHHLRSALQDFHEVDSLESLETDSQNASRADPAAAFDSDLTPLDAGSGDDTATPPERAEPPTGDTAEESTETDQSALDTDAIRSSLENLEGSIDAQIEELEAQRAMIEHLRERLD